MPSEYILHSRILPSACQMLNQRFSPRRSLLPVRPSRLLRTTSRKVGGPTRAHPPCTNEDCSASNPLCCVAYDSTIDVGFSMLSKLLSDSSPPALSVPVPSFPWSPPAATAFPSFLRYSVIACLLVPTFATLILYVLSDTPSMDPSRLPHTKIN